MAGCHSDGRRPACLSVVKTNARDALSLTSRNAGGVRQAGPQRRKASASQRHLAVATDGHTWSRSLALLWRRD